MLSEKLYSTTDILQSHKTKIQKLESEIEKLKFSLEKTQEDNKIADQKTKEFIDGLDIDNYDLRSDDFKDKKPLPTKPLPKGVPRLDMNKVFDWKEEMNKEESKGQSNISQIFTFLLNFILLFGIHLCILIFIADAEEEEEEDEEFDEQYAKDMPQGSALDSETSLTRKGSLLRRKEMVIDQLNKGTITHSNYNNLIILLQPMKTMVQ